METYSYQKIVNIDTLTESIQSSSIVTALDEVNMVSGTTNCIFKAALSTEDKTTLDTLVNANDPTITITSDPTLVTLAGDNQIQTIKPYTTDVDNRKILVPPVSDRTTWYQNSILVTDEVLTADALFKTYTANHQNFINILSNNLTIRHDSVLQSDGTYTTVDTYTITVKVNGVIIGDPASKNNSEYTIDYRGGSVTFTTPLTSTDVVTCTYHYENGSVFKIRPPAGSVYRMLRSRILTSVVTNDFVSPVYFAIYAGDPSYTYYDYYFGKKPFCQFIFMYRSLRDLMIDSDDSKVLQLAPFTYDVLDLKLNYDRSMILDSQYFVEARIGILNDIEMTDFEIFNLHMSLECLSSA